MATVNVQLELKTAEAHPSWPFPAPLLEYSQPANKAGAVPLYSLVFPDNFSTAAFFTFSTWAVGTTPALNLFLDWSAATTGNVYWEAAISVIKIADAVNISGTKAFAGAVGAAFAASATLGGPARSTISMASSLDGFGTSNTGSVVAVRVMRVGGTSLDTAPSPAKLRRVSLQYSDT